MDIEIDLGYYDKILAGMTFSLASGATAGVLTSFPLQYTFGAGAAVSMGLMYHGMFENGPIAE
ncbi:hypothetical protein [Candidatus Nanohalococcus occultus]|uniref:Membrane protein n=1 Tax=Candidatus Nanohalococcus occultus TaxID=2978047 RepID=A0ABY8CEC9_9ARCH|nr:putative membrane protein [Candidatus Nanohaloarchaeota archaeon SVXNc]